MATQPVFHGEFDDRLDRMTVKYMTYVNTMQDNLLTQMRVDKRDMLQAVDDLRSEVIELKSQVIGLLQRHNALEALVMAQQREIKQLTQVVQQLHESMNARAQDTATMVADAFAHQAEENNEKFAAVHKILEEILRRLPPEQQSR